MREGPSDVTTHESDPPAYRIGHGYDLHRLEPPPPEGNGRPFVLGGLPVEHDRGPVGHSDGDALFHAVTDALLASVGLPDIGELFPDTDPQWDGASSDIFLVEAAKRVDQAGYAIENIDCTVILERPKVKPIKGRLIRQIAGVVGIPTSRVNVKGKTHEQVDAVGEGRAIEVHVVALVYRRE